jgi:hypothetical protein
MGTLKFWPVKVGTLLYLFDSLRHSPRYVSLEALEVHFIGNGDAAFDSRWDGSLTRSPWHTSQLAGLCHWSATASTSIELAIEGNLNTDMFHFNAPGYSETYRKPSIERTQRGRSFKVYNYLQYRKYARVAPRGFFASSSKSHELLETPCPMPCTCPA